jgi:hypothetical protein
MILAGVIIVVSVAFLVGAAVRILGALFSVRIRTQIVAHPVLHGLWFLGALLFGAATFFAPTSRGPHEPGILKTSVTRSALKTACKSFLVEYKMFPSGDNATITAALRGANPRRVIFIELNSRDVNSVGEVVDPWGTPYRFTMENGQPPLIRSAGPDRAFDTKDDLISSSP